jgi:DNA repair protein RadC
MELFVRSAGRLRRADKDEILAAAAQYAAIDIARERAVSPQKMRELALKYLGPREAETFSVFWLDSRNRLIAFEELFRGTIDGAPVYPRELVKLALSRNAAAVILCHNHPSADPEPSVADELITKTIKRALELVGVRVLDHLIVGGTTILSFVERGLI